jgi:hypothetical protein
MHDDLDRLLTPDEAVEELARCGVRRSTRTLANLRTEGRGPAFRRDGIRPRYPVGELRRWAAEQLSPLVRHTTEERQAGRVLPGREAVNG